MTVKRLIILLILSLLLSNTTSAQEWQGVSYRASVGVQWKVSPRFSASASYQIRTQPGFKGVDRQSIGGSVKYKFTNWLSIGTGYSYLASNNPKNRFSFDATGSIRAGEWRFSLKENFQLNNKNYSINRYEEAQNDLALKNTFRVCYSALKKIEPYASFEARLSLNDAKWTYEYDEVSGTYLNPQFLGYKSVYFSRFKPAIGIDWEIVEHHSIDFRVLCDFAHGQEIKASSDGTELISISWNNKIKLSTSVGYTFSF